VILDDIAQQVRNITGSLVKDKPVEMVVDIDPELPQVRADQVRLRQILNNLVSNAAKFTNEGEIRIRAELLSEPLDNFGSGEAVLISVRDTGEGIAPDHLDLVFEQFQQVDGSSTRKASGTGMGLTITRHLIQMHGGRIWVESTVGEGSTFYFTIPVTHVSDVMGVGD
jgi:two-component system sensor histidine kinase ChiS